MDDRDEVAYFVLSLYERVIGEDEERDALGRPGVFSYHEGNIYLGSLPLCHLASYMVRIHKGVWDTSKQLRVALPEFVGLLTRYRPQITVTMDHQAYADVPADISFSSRMRAWYPLYATTSTADEHRQAAVFLKHGSVGHDNGPTRLYKTKYGVIFAGQRIGGNTHVFEVTSTKITASSARAEPLRELLETYASANNLEMCWRPSVTRKRMKEVAWYKIPGMDNRDDSGLLKDIRYPTTSAGTTGTLILDTLRRLYDNNREAW